MFSGSLECFNEVLLLLEINEVKIISYQQYY